MALTVYTSLKLVFTERECQEGEAKSFCSQVWWKIAIVWVLPSPVIGHSDAQKCHSSRTSDILETLQFANGSHLVEAKDVNAHLKANRSREGKANAELGSSSRALWHCMSQGGPGNEKICMAYHTFAQMHEEEDRCQQNTAAPKRIIQMITEVTAPSFSILDFRVSKPIIYFGSVWVSSSY